jgi:hypothetical protein
MSVASVAGLVRPVRAGGISVASVVLRAAADLQAASTAVVRAVLQADLAAAWSAPLLRDLPKRRTTSRMTRKSRPRTMRTRKNRPTNKNSASWNWLSSEPSEPDALATNARIISCGAFPTCPSLAGMLETYPPRDVHPPGGGPSFPFGASGRLKSNSGWYSAGVTARRSGGGCAARAFAAARAAHQRAKLYAARTNPRAPNQGAVLLKCCPSLSSWTITRSVTEANSQNTPSIKFIRTAHSGAEGRIWSLWAAGDRIATPPAAIVVAFHTTSCRPNTYG